MKKVKIGSCKYIYYNSENTYMLTYDPSDDWGAELKGEVIEGCEIINSQNLQIK